MNPAYQVQAPDSRELASAPGAVLLEFGVDWCPHCQAADPAIHAALVERTGIHHLRIEDGRGRPLGRAYGVKLWPTLVLLRQGVEIGRVVRPTDAAAVRSLLDRLSD
ncbi:MAG: thioredoxin family protein [Gammaproteobacteria bacterium]